MARFIPAGAEIGTRGLACLTFVLLAGAAFAQQPAPPRAANPPKPSAAPVTAPVAADKKPDLAFEAARASFEALPDADRRALQDALVWTGDFNGVDTGTFGRRTYDALLAYQRRGKTAPDGTLDPAERTALLAAGRKAKEAAGFALRTDAASGAVLGVPVRALPREQAQPHGTRWQSPDGRVSLETRSYAPGETDLAATFDRLAATTPDRRVTYKLKRPDFLVVTGETASGRFYIRYADTPAGLRGFTFSYDKAVAAETDKLVIAVANSFVAQPDAAAMAVQPATPTAPGMAAAARPAAPPLVTGFEVASGRLLTSAAALAACGSVRLGAAPVRLIAKTEMFALIAIPERPRGGRPQAGPAPEAGDPLVVLASDGASGAVAIAGEAATPKRLTAPLQPGGAGAPVFDRSGRFVGLVASYPSAPRLIAGIAPPAGYDLLPAAAAAAFLRDNGIASPSGTEPEPATTGEIAGVNAAAVRTLACAP